MFVECFSQFFFSSIFFFFKKSRVDIVCEMRAGAESRQVEEGRSTVV
jgi:hypothetical protein